MIILKVTFAIVLAALVGAAWRRWWGDVPAVWWPWKRPNGDGIGYRAMQAVAGLLLLGLILLAAGAPVWKAAVASACTIGYLTAVARSIPHIWIATEWLEQRGWLPRLGRMLTGYTAWGEAFAGAAGWMIAAVAV